MSDAATPNPSPLTEPYAMAQGEDMTLPIVIYVLYLVAIPTAFLSLLIGVILAYVNKDEAGAAVRSHYEFQIRTFWLTLLWIPIGVLIILVGIPLMVVLIGFAVIALGALMLAGGKLWYVIRCIVGLVAAAQGRPYANPRALLV